MCNCGSQSQLSSGVEETESLSGALIGCDPPAVTFCSPALVPAAAQNWHAQLLVGLEALWCPTLPYVPPSSGALHFVVFVLKPNAEMHNLISGGSLLSLLCFLIVLPLLRLISLSSPVCLPPEMLSRTTHGKCKAAGHRFWCRLSRKKNRNGWNNRPSRGIVL